jgi:hypothetical protein
MEEIQKRTKAADEMFCPSCGEPVKAQAVICVHCGVALRPAGYLPATPFATLPPVPFSPKQKSTAVLLAVFLGPWTWCYTYQRHAWKFWLNLALSVVTLGAWALVAWLWAVIDTSVQSQDFYRRFPHGT